MKRIKMQIKTTWLQSENMRPWVSYIINIYNFLLIESERCAFDKCEATQSLSSDNVNAFVTIIP